MKISNLISDVNLDNIVFDSRNKMYGAYVLRKEYNKRLLSSLFLALSGMFILSLIPYVLTKINWNETILVEDKKDRSDETYIIKKYVFPDEREIAKEKPIEQKRSNSSAEAAPVVVDKVEGKTEIKTHDNTGDSKGTGPNTNIAGPVVADTFSGTHKFLKDSIYPVAAVPPNFSGDLGNFLASHLIYPEEAKENEIEGTVYLSFIVDKDGNVKDIAPMSSRKMNKDLENEAIRVTKLMPKWTPGKNEKGEAISVQCVQPFKFKLNR
jgi:protein TonB